MSKIFPLGVVMAAAMLAACGTTSETIPYEQTDAYKYHLADKAKAYKISRGDGSTVQEYRSTFTNPGETVLNEQQAPQREETVQPIEGKADEIFDRRLSK